MDLVRSIYEQNEWANLRLIDVCRDLSEEQLDATTVGAYGSIKETLRHIVVAEGGYAFRLGDSDIERLRFDDPWPGLDRLADFVRINTASLIRAAGAAKEGDLVKVGTETTYIVHPDVILVQAFNHGTEHREQVGAILTSLAIDHPELSGWEWGLATGRMNQA